MITFSSTVVVADPGATAILDCVASGKPQPSVAWQHRGRQLARDSQHSPLSNGTLLVFGVEGTNEGHYECHAENVAGSDSVTVLLAIT